MRCEEVTRLLYAHLDEELSPELSSLVEQHLAACGGCRGLAESEVKFREQFIAPLRAIKVPAGVRRRILEGVSAIDRGAAKGVRFRITAKIGAAVAAGFLGVLVAIQAGPESLAPLSSIASSSVSTHVKFSSGYLPLEIALEGNWRNTLENWFEGKVGFSVRIPMVQGGDAHLVGGRLSHLLHVDAAYVVYLYRGDYVSLFLFDGQAVKWTGGQTELFDDRRIHSFHDRGFDVMVWRQGPVGYALVTRARQEILGAVVRVKGEDAVSPRG